MLEELQEHDLINSMHITSQRHSNSRSTVQELQEQELLFFRIDLSASRNNGY